MHLLSNNLAVQDRERLQHLYHEMVRTQRIAYCLSLYLGYETTRRVPQLAGLAPGWKFLSILGIGWFYKNFIMQYYSGYSGPVMGAFLRKYNTQAKHDMFDIKDPKREYFYIDTSEYMNYSNESLGDHYHASHGPQPEGEA